MNFLDNMVKSSNALIKDRLNNPFGNRQQATRQSDGQAAPEAGESSQRLSEQSAPIASSGGQTSQDITDDKAPLTGSKDEGDRAQFAAIAADAEIVTQKAVAGAKNLGNFLFSMANKAGQTVSQTAKQVKQAVENTNLLTDLSREQQEFIKQHGGNLQSAELPWASYNDETKAKEMREQILLLSQDKRNFVRSPPNDANFQFDPQQCYPVALSLLKEDPNLGNMRFELVPKFVSEDSFWCNYFYRVSLLKRLVDEGGEPAKVGWASSRSSSGEGPDEVTTHDDSNQLIEDLGQTTNIKDQVAQQEDISSYSAEGLESEESKKLFAEADDLKNKLKELDIGSLDHDDDQDG